MNNGLVVGLVGILLALGLRVADKTTQCYVSGS